MALTDTDEPGAGRAIDTVIGHNLRRARERAGLGRHEVAQSVDVSAAEYDEWEAGTRRPAPARLIELARLLNVQLADLFASRG